VKDLEDLLYKGGGVADLRPICPNCHAMVHLEAEAMELSDLKKVIKKSRR
jgi:predicted HNH restriction endonuclease